MFFRCYPKSHIHQDVTRVGGGNDQEALNRFFIGISRADEIGKNSIYYTERPFTYETFERWKAEPESLRRTPGGNYTIGNEEPTPIHLDARRNRPDMVGSREVPHGLGPVFRGHIDDMLRKGTSPYSPYFEEQDQPYALQRAVSLGIMPKEALAPHLPEMLGPRFWTRPDLANIRGNMQPEEQAKVAKSLAAYPDQIAQAIVGSGQNNPQTFLESEMAYQEKRQRDVIQPMAPGPERDRMAMDAAGKVQYLQHLQKHPDQMPTIAPTPATKPGETKQQHAAIHVTADQVTVSGGQNMKVNVNGPSTGLVKVPSIDETLDHLMRSPAPLTPQQRGFIYQSTGNYPPPQTQVGGGRGSSGSGSSGDGGGGQGGGRGSSGNGPGFGFNNQYLQEGRTLARLGDEMAYMSQWMQKTADSAIDEGSSYRLATMQIPQAAGATTDSYGHIYASMQQGNQQQENGGPLASMARVGMGPGGPGGVMAWLQSVWQNIMPGDSMNLANQAQQELQPTTPTPPPQMSNLARVGMGPGGPGGVMAWLQSVWQNMIPGSSMNLVRQAQQ